MKYIIAILIASLAFGNAIAEVSQDLGYIHKSQLFYFPEEIGLLQRSEFKDYSGDEKNISFSYKSNYVPSLVITIYAYPTTRLKDGNTIELSDHFDNIERFILKPSPRKKSIEKTDWPEGILILTDERVPYILGAYSLTYDEVLCNSLAELYDYGNWSLKLRATYYSSEAEIAEELIDHLHKNFKW